MDGFISVYYELVIPLVISILLWYQLEVGDGWDNLKQCFEMDSVYIVLNILTIYAIILVLTCITTRYWISGLLLSFCIFIISIVNYYTIKFHGMPLTIYEIANFKTGLSVIKSYDIKVDIFSILIVIIFFIQMVFILVVRNREKNRRLLTKKLVLRYMYTCIIASGIVYVGYTAPSPIKPQATVGWSWKEAYHQYGYLACSLELIHNSKEVVEMPKGYSALKVNSIEIEKREREGKIKPDIILILNESFYDLNQIIDLRTDLPFMENIEKMDNTIRGYAVVPGVGGGTNSSEYELLTSNSLQLMKGITPFNVLNMKGANSIVTHLNTLQYYTIGAHSESGSNYARARAYPDMGFDRVFFDNDFKDKEYYANRWYETDESLYKNLISWYDDSQTAAPQFIYLLTIQNHGGWDLNPEEEDIIHAENDLGEYKKQVNEFLSSIYLSDIAFYELTQYFTKIDRPVLICMVGDHSPAFAEKIVDGKYTGVEKNKRLRSTPFIIWANWDIESKDMGYLSMNFLVPTLLETAGIPLSPYYQYQINLKSDIPVVTSFDKFFDNKGNCYSYDDDTCVYKEQVDNYFYLEYNNLEENKIQDFFEVYR